jgi:hypothetical protein
MRCRQRSETKECMRPRPRRASAVPRARHGGIAAWARVRSDPILIELLDVKAAILRTATTSASAGRRPVDEPAARGLR